MIYPCSRRHTRRYDMSLATSITLIFIAISKAGKYPEQGLSSIAFDSLCVHYVILYIIAVCYATDSWTYSFVEVSGHNLESSQTWGWNFVPITDKNLASGVNTIPEAVHFTVYTTPYSTQYSYKCGMSNLLKLLCTVHRKAITNYLIWKLFWFGRFTIRIPCRLNPDQNTWV